MHQVATPLAAYLFGLVTVLVPGSPAAFSQPSPKTDTTKSDNPLEGFAAFAELDRRILERAGVKTDRASIEAFLVSRAGNDEDLLQLSKLVAQLDHPRFREREVAGKKLQELRLPAVPALERAAVGPGEQLQLDAKKCLAAIHETAAPHVTSAAVRELGKPSVPSTVAALLRYFPYGSEDQRAMILNRLCKAAREDAAVAAEVAKRIADPVPARRAAAACVLGQVDGEKWHDLAGAALKDPDAGVRLRAAHGLLAGKDTAGVPTLIELCADPVPMIRWQATALLDWLAEGTGKAPRVNPAGAVEEGAQLRAEFSKWWAAASADKDHYERERRTLPALTALVVDVPPNAAKVWRRLVLITAVGRVVFELKTTKYLDAAGVSECGAIFAFNLLDASPYWWFITGDKLREAGPVKWGGRPPPCSEVNRTPTGTLLSVDQDEILETSVFWPRERGSAGSRRWMDRAADRDGIRVGVGVTTLFDGKPGGAGTIEAGLVHEEVPYVTADERQLDFKPPADGGRGFWTLTRLRPSHGAFVYTQNMQTLWWVGRTRTVFTVPPHVQIGLLGDVTDDWVTVAGPAGKGFYYLWLEPTGRCLAEQRLGIASLDQPSPVSMPASVKAAFATLSVGFGRQGQKNDLLGAAANAKLLRSPDPIAVERAIKALTGILEARPLRVDRKGALDSAGELAAKLNVKEDAIREALTTYFNAAGSDGMPALLKALQTTKDDPHRGVVVGTAHSVLSVNTSIHSAWESELCLLAASEIETTRLGALQLLEAMKARTKPSDVLLAASSSHHKATRLRALASLIPRRGTRAPDPILPALCQHLSARPEDEACLILEIARRYSKLPTEVVGAMRKCLASSSEKVRNATYLVLKEHSDR